MNYFKSKRIEKGYSQLHISEVLGYGSKQFISNVERGITMYRAKDSKKLAHLFGVTEVEIIQEIFRYRTEKLREELGIG